MPLYLEDFTPGAVFELGRIEMTRERILSFAREFDPQPFHTDEEAAKSSIYGGLIASGWHACAAFMRLFVDGVLGSSTRTGRSSCRSGPRTFFRAGRSARPHGASA
jgi:acyl dehydratase